MATKIILNRKSEMINRARGFKIFIDGKETGKLANGGTEEIAVEPGSHVLQCKIDWCSSPALNFDIKEGETRFFIARSGMKYYTVGVVVLLASFLSGPLLKLLHMPRPENLSMIQMLFLFPLLIYMLYYLTIGKKKYISLEVDKDNFFN